MNLNFLKKYCVPVAAFLVLFAQQAFASEKQVFSYYGSSGVYAYKNQYFVQLLQAILENTNRGQTEIELNLVSEKLSQNRIVELMSTQCMADIIWFVSSGDREKQLLPIRIPLLKGLSGYRSLMIHKDSQPQFDEIQTEQQLAMLAAGQGSDWPDTLTLQHNGYNVVPVNNFLALFDMLEDKRFDYFPRSVAEIGAELEHFAHKPLAMERNFMLYYPSPIYFFVCPQKPELAHRIANGLQQVIANGSFDSLFEQSHDYQSFIAAGGFKHKTIFPMSNPNLDPKTLNRDMSLWLTPENHSPKLRQ